MTLIGVGRLYALMFSTPADDPEAASRLENQVYQPLEARVSPLHLTRSEAMAERAAARQEQTLSAAPALWSLITCIALLIPILVS